MTKQLTWKGYRRPLSEKNIVVMSTNGIVWANVPLYLKEVNHSPTGFEWGYYGSGPAQLAYAILRTWEEMVEGRDKRQAKAYALRMYQVFKDDVIAGIKEDEWTITSERVGTWVSDYLEKYPERRPVDEEPEEMDKVE
jgi:hypothetical protein